MYMAAIATLLIAAPPLQPIASSRRVPAGVRAAVAERYPNAQLSTVLQCTLGPKNIEAWGIFFITPEVFKAAVVLRSGISWGLHLVASGNGSQDGDIFEDEFFHGGELVTVPLMKCTDPRKDKKIDKTEVAYHIRDPSLLAAQQLCFQRSVVYADAWSCYVYDPKSRAIRLSFETIISD